MALKELVIDGELQRVWWCPCGYYERILALDTEGWP